MHKIGIVSQPSCGGIRENTHDPTDVESCNNPTFYEAEPHIAVLNNNNLIDGLLRGLNPSIFIPTISLI